MDSLRSCQKLLLCPTEPIPDGSKDEHAGQGWANYGGKASVITHLRTKINKKWFHNFNWSENM